MNLSQSDLNSGNYRICLRVLNIKIETIKSEKFFHFERTTRRNQLRTFKSSMSNITLITSIDKSFIIYGNRESDTTRLHTFSHFSLATHPFLER